jgi:hypothetical protein
MGNYLKKINPWFKNEGGNSQNFLGKFVRFFVTLGTKILRLFRLKVLFEEDIIKG